jgi:hypothetical protein
MGQKVPQARWMVYFIGKSKKKEWYMGYPHDLGSLHMYRNITMGYTNLQSVA